MAFCELFFFVVFMRIRIHFAFCMEIIQFIFVLLVSIQIREYNASVVLT